MDVSDDWEITTDVLHDWATFSVSQSSETSILISQSSKTSIRDPNSWSQSSILSTTTPFALPIVENVHGRSQHSLEQAQTGPVAGMSRIACQLLELP